MQRSVPLNLVDEQNRTLLFRQTIEHLLDTLLEVAAIAGARNERTKVEREHACVQQRLGNFTLVDAQRQAFRQRRFADARFTHQQRIVLASAAQHLHHALDLLVPADERIQPAASRAIHQIGRERFERVARSGGLFARFRPPRHGRRAFAPAVRNRAQQRQTVEALLAKKIRRVAVVFLQQEHEQRSAVHLPCTRRRGVDDGTLDDAIEADGRFGLDGFFPGHRRKRLGQHLVEIATQLRQVDAAGRQ
jgi:hypothetical protein